MAAGSTSRQRSSRRGGWRKRKTTKYEQTTQGGALWNRLDDPMMETVLAKLPVTDIFRVRSVCKRWNSFARSQTFLAACAEVKKRPPWFFMLDVRYPSGVVYDLEYRCWRFIKPRGLSKIRGRGKLPVAASGGLICIRTSVGDLAVWNPLTGSIREIPVLETKHPVLAISMITTSPSFYRILVVYGTTPNFGMKVFSSDGNSWKELSVIGCFTFTKWKQFENAGEVLDSPRLQPRDLERRVPVIPRTGIIQRIPAKALSGVVTRWQGPDEVIHFLNPNGGRWQGGQEVLHFLYPNGRVVACDPFTGTMHIYPQILPIDIEYSVDIVACGGRMFVVILHEMMECASLRVWQFDPVAVEWRQFMAMPPAMSQEYYGRKADINCVGYEDLIMMCISSTQFYRVVMCNISDQTWVELPKCFDPCTHKMKKFVSAYSFEPRIEAIP